MKAICVFCGSSDAIRGEYLHDARRLGEAVAHRGLQLVYGGGGTGLMSAVAEGAMQAGGEVIGIIPSFFNRPQLANHNLTRLEVVETMHQRKARMAELADAFIALPGGFGTLEELFEALTWAQVGLHRKPIGLLNTANYFDPLLTLIDHAWSEGFIYAEHRTLFTYAGHPELLLDTLSGYRPPPGLERWVDRPDGGQTPLVE